MRKLTENLGLLVYGVRIESSMVSKTRRVAVNGEVRRTTQSVPPGSFDQHPGAMHPAGALTSDEDADPNEQTTPQQFPPVRKSLIDHNQTPRRRTSSDDSLTPSSINNRVANAKHSSSL